MERDICSGCGMDTIVHGNTGEDFGNRVMLCDDCCPCYNHAPGGKYHKTTMIMMWYGGKRVDISMSYM